MDLNKSFKRFEFYSAYPLLSTVFCLLYSAYCLLFPVCFSSLRETVLFSMLFEASAVKSIPYFL